MQTVWVSLSIKVGGPDLYSIHFSLLRTDSSANLLLWGIKLGVFASLYKNENCLSFFSCFLLFILAFNLLWIFLKFGTFFTFGLHIYDFSFSSCLIISSFLLLRFLGYGKLNGCYFVFCLLFFAISNLAEKSSLFR